VTNLKEFFQDKIDWDFINKVQQYCTRYEDQGKIVLFEVITSGPKKGSCIIYQVHKGKYVRDIVRDDEILMRLYKHNGLKYRIEIRQQDSNNYYNKCDGDMKELFDKLNSMYEASEAKLDHYVIFKP